MGVPKFYRWLSERYPLVNQAIRDDVRPEFGEAFLSFVAVNHYSMSPLYSLSSPRLGACMVTIPAVLTDSLYVLRCIVFGYERYNPCCHSWPWNRPN